MHVYAALRVVRFGKKSGQVASQAGAGRAEHRNAGLQGGAYVGARFQIGLVRRSRASQSRSQRCASEILLTRCVLDL